MPENLILFNIPGMYGVITMKEIISRLLTANRRYCASGLFDGDISERRRSENAAAQKPYAAVITCSDSRVAPELLFSAGLGELFVIRTAGNVIGDSEFASLAYAVEHLHTSAVIVMGHTGCGAVKAALHGEFDGPVGTITRRIKCAIGSETDPRAACVLNVRQGVNTIRERLGDADITVTGAVADIASGKVEFID